MKLKFSIYTIIFCLIHSSIYSQYSINGFVKEAGNNNNISGAVIQVVEAKRSAITNSEGNFFIPAIQKGQYNIKIKATGFKNLILKLNVSKDTGINFFLVPNFSELNEVVVTAVSRTTQLKLSPVIIKPVDASQLNQNSSTNLIDALKNIPGINPITTGSGISKPTIRGLGYNRVISLFNGIRQEGQQWGDEHGIEIDEYAINRVEIVKGPGSLMYGSDAIAGVLNFITPKSATINNASTQVITNYQTNNKLMGISISNSGYKNSFSWLARMSSKLASTYQNKEDGKVFNSGFQEYNANIYLGISKSWGYSHLNISTYNVILNIVEGERNIAGNFVYDFANSNGTITKKTVTSKQLNGYKVGIPYQIVNHIRVMSNNFFQLKKGSLLLDLGYQNNKRKEFGNAVFAKRKDQYFDLHTINYSLRYNFLEKNKWATTIGINGMQQKNMNRGIEFLIPEYNLLDIGSFIITQKTLNKITLAGGVRFDVRFLKTDKLILDSLKRPVAVESQNTKIKFKPLNKLFNNFSGSIGLSYQITNNQTVKFNFSRGFRAPSIAELTSNGQHEGTFRYEFGTETLQSEISHQIDIAYFNSSVNYTFEFTPFINFVSNYIFTQKLRNVLGGDSIVNPNNSYPAIKYVQGNAVLVGGELYVNFHPSAIKWLNVENAFSFVQATQFNKPDSAKYLPFIPSPKINSNIKFQINKLTKVFTNMYFKIGADFYLEQNKFYKANNTETKTPAYTLLNAGFGGNIKLQNKKEVVSVFFNADNILNTSYQNHLSRLKYAPKNNATGKMGVFNMGRNFSLKAIINF
jgi:iron complex outermembrane receptor protein